MSHSPYGVAKVNGNAAARDRAIASPLFGLIDDQQEALQSSFLSVTDDLPIPVYVTDPEGRPVYYNAAAAELWGDELVPWDVVLWRTKGRQHGLVAHTQPLFAAKGQGVATLHLLLNTGDADRSEEDTQRLAAIVEDSDDAIISKQLDGTITSWNGGAERLFGYKTEEIVGRSILTLIPEDRQDEEVRIIERLRRGERIEHFETVRRHKSGAMLDISLTISPIKRRDGTIVGASKIARDITQRKHAEEMLQRQAERLAALNRVSRIISQDLDLDRIVQAVTDEATALSGAQIGAFFYNVCDAAGQSYFLQALSGTSHECFDGLGRPRITQMFAPTFAGEGIVRSNDVRQDRRFGGSAPHHGLPAGHPPVVSYLAVPVVSASGEVIGGLLFGHEEPGRFAQETEALIMAIAGQAAMAIDNARLHSAAREEIAQRKAAEGAKELLLHEVKHRAKNTLATIQALATQTLKGAPADERDTFIKRLHALSGAHDLLTQSDWRDVGISALARQSLAAFSGNGTARVTSKGPDIGLSPNKALLLTMVLHELGTNAVKYGALSVEQGRVQIIWRMAVAERPTLQLEWRESGGPPVTPPERQGFGSRMIAAALHGGEGNVAFDYRPAGLQVMVDMAL
jgi:PAS domain S-box-containing protein